MREGQYGQQRPEGGHRRLYRDQQQPAIEDVRKLLGNPGRTTIRTDGNSSSETTRSTLQWIYTWSGTAGTGTLRVDFGSKTPEAWKVTSWAWATY